MRSEALHETHLIVDCSIPIVFQHTGAWTVGAYARCEEGMALCGRRFPVGGICLRGAMRVEDFI